jgi:Holliday junction DNA helicase RuvA
MFDYIKGSLVFSHAEEAVIETHGVGYRLLISAKTHQKLPQEGHQATLFISSVIREDSHRYFGFLTRDDRNFFEMLIEFSGIGPKTALSILGHFDPSELVDAAACGDVVKISKVPGVGKKTAEKLVIELKGKNLKIAPSLGNLLPKSSKAQDALAALLQLGFAYPHAQKAISEVLGESSQELSLSDVITASLQRIRK